MTVAGPRVHRVAGTARAARIAIALGRAHAMELESRVKHKVNTR